MFTSKVNKFLKISVILLQIVMVSPGTHQLVKHDRESLSRTNESQLKKNDSKIENAWDFMSPDSSNLKTDSKTPYYSILK